MTPDEIRACVAYANGIDPRVQMTPPNRDLWARVLRDKRYIEVTTATQVYYERLSTSQYGRRPVEPSDIKKIIYEETNRQGAVQSALEAAPRIKNPNNYRARNPELWEQLVAEGRDKHRAGLRSRGITPHAEGCPDCSRPRR